MNKKHGVFTEPGTICFERILNGSAEEVWKYLTESEFKAKWLSAGDVEPKVGGTVTHEFDHSRLSKEDDPLPEKYKDLEEGQVSKGVVTKYDRPHVLSYTWDEGDGEGSEVTFELESHGEEQVLLRLTHRKLPTDSDTKAGIGAGWHTHLSILIDCVDNKDPKPFWNVHMPLEKEYEQLISNLSDN
ncbi:MAG: ATPase [Balneola sp.]|jgi:uncharacterized protein YndB with AHSA1/START domain|nr:ATPase [Balneola sp.]MAL18912.1 ATPase [Balneola sp.]MBE78791.1 ATPase [Balneola sp.]HBX64964.1 ATPase [Balneolaceae bacterium]|tara:strand:- start:151 stop:708 length:558 start_codon:yes stop_codon:yes gene_type:complete